MRANPIRWVIPGIVTVLLGTAAAVQTTRASMEADLAARAETALQRAGFDWAEVHFDARDAVLGGLTTSPGQEEDAQRLLAGLHGVRSVTEAVATAPRVSPYPFRLALADGKLHIEGGVPDENVRRSLLERSGAATSDLKLLSGMPDREAWLAATDFALRQMTQLDRGEITLSDLDMSIEGRAKSPEAFRKIGILLNAGLPDGVRSAGIDITPPLQSPYHWQAVFDGTEIDLNGFAPSRDAIEIMMASAPEGLSVTPSLQLASGAPESFGQTASTLIGAFAHVDNGEARIEDTAVSFSGAPSSEAAIAMLDEKLSPLGAQTDLAPPRIDDYVLTASRENGRITLAGHIPGEDVRAKLAALDADAAGALPLGRGAPEGFAAAVDFGVTALGLMNEGSFSIENNDLAVTGSARDAAAYTALRELTAAGLPDGMTLRTAQIESFVAMPYLWSAERSAEGYTISGYVPAEATRKFIAARAGDIAADTTQIAAGAPADFGIRIRAAFDALALVGEGRAAYTGTQWLFTGRAASPDQHQTIAAALGEGWELDLNAGPAAAEAPEVEGPAAEAAPVTQDTTPPENAADSGMAEETPPAGKPEAETPAEPAETAQTAESEAETLSGEQPAAEPALYRFSAKKPADAPIRFFGVVPAQSTARYLAVLAGNAPTDGLFVYGGAPEDFIGNAVAGVRALAMLNEGELLHEKGEWSLTGTATTAADREAVLAGLEAAPADWRTEIGTIPPQVLCAAHLQAFAAENRILFAPASSRLTPDSLAQLDRLVAYLEECPAVPVHVEGHTDSDGAEDANLALSVARAEAVVAALVERGVDPARLYAVGYGESLPIAPNDTSEGKRRNRRIAFSIVEQ